MTATITISCPDGIVLAADQKITYWDPNGNFAGSVKGPVNKILTFKNTNVGASWWGHYYGKEFGNNRILDVLSDFEKQVTNKDDIITISEKLKDYLETKFPEFKSLMGIHLAGYYKFDKDCVPELRHVFHERWNKPGEFILEKSTEEYHELITGKKIPHNYTPYYALFNGDNTVANLFFNKLPKIYPKRKRSIILEKLDLEKCQHLAELTINVSSGILDFLTEVDVLITKDKKEISGLNLATITLEKGFQFLNK